MAHAKIIGIHDGKHIETSQRTRPLPASIIKLRDEIKTPIKNLLRTLFDNADDALFSMADKAGANGDQNIYIESMRELRLQKKLIANAFMQQITLSFTNVNNYSDNEVDESSSASLENLSVLKNDEMEVSVALEGMISRLRNSATNQLSDLHKRVESLVNGCYLKTKHLPIGPEILCEAFAFASSELDVDLKAKIVIFKLFEKYVLRDMPEVYTHANQILAQLGVLPTLKKQRFINHPSPSASVSQTSSSQGVPSGHAGVGSHEDQSVPMLGKEQCLTEGQFEQIRSLMHATSSSPAIEQSSNSNVVLINQDQLVSALSHQQFSSSKESVESKSYEHVDFRSLISNAFLSQSKQSDGKSIKYDEIDNDIINLVSMLFDFILDDRQLQSSMKALIARLQIPILKVALIDKSFFDRGGHPARKLLNEMASAAIGWSEKSSGKSDRLKAKIESVVERVLSDFDSNLAIFDDLLLEFSQFIDLESRRGQLIEQRTKDSEKGRAATELAKKASETVINTIIQSKEYSAREIPECVLTLLTEGWSRVMILDYLKLGETSSEWKGHQVFINDLVWSVCPSSDGSDSRAKLLQLIPILMKRLHQGLQEASFDEFRLSTLLSELEAIHIATLKDLHQQSIEEAEAQAKKAEAALLKEANKLESGDTTVSNAEVEDDFKASLDVEEDFKAFQQKLSTKEINDVLNAHQEEQSEVLSSNITEPANKISLSENDEVSPQIVIDENDPFMQQVSRFSVGCWFEFSQNGQSERAKLAAVIKVNGRYIFVNRSGVKVAEKTKQELAVDLKQGAVQVLNDGLLFDRALESIIGNLRGQE